MDWSERYAEVHPRYRDFTSEVESIIRKNLRAAGIDVASFEARTKELASFSEKIQREEGKYEQPLVQITDLSGCRIICYYPDEIDSVEKIVRKNFSVDEENSVRRDKIIDPQHFGYQSRHLIVMLNDARMALDENKRFKGMKCEVQIRTVLQNAWAAIEHKIQYKRREQVPKDFQRIFFQLSAMLEVADERFQYIRNAMEVREVNVRNKLAEAGATVPLTVETLDIYVRENPYLKSVLGKLPRSKIRVISAPKSLDKMHDLLRALNTADISDSAGLDEFLRGKTQDEWVTLMLRYLDARNAVRFPEGVPDPNPILGVTVPTMLKILLVLAKGRSKGTEIMRRVPFPPLIQKIVARSLGDT